MKLHWPATLQINLFRSLFAGLVYAIVAHPIMIIAYPAIYMVGIIPISFVTQALCSGIRGVGCIPSLLITLPSLVGDPFVYVLRLIKPELVPAPVKIITFQPIIKVEQ